MVLLKLTLIVALLTLIAVLALSFRLFFRKDIKVYGSCSSGLSSDAYSGGGCGCGGSCGCGGGDGK